MTADDEIGSSAGMCGIVFSMQKRHDGRAPKNEGGVSLPGLVKYIAVLYNSSPFILLNK